MLHRNVQILWSALLVCSLLGLTTGGCASGKTLKVWMEGGAAPTDATTVNTDGPANDSGLVNAPEGGASTADSAPNVDEDNDGHCAPGAIDPSSKCKSFQDCDDKDKTSYPGAMETCADVGVDNDCDGDAAEVDLDQDGKSDLGTPCTTSLPGICKEGTRPCDAGKLVCKEQIKKGQKAEVCDGLDDDCDGTPDNGQLCDKGNTCGGTSGCQCKGGTGCTGLLWCCGPGCADLSKDTSNCGACGVGCGKGETCDNKRCRCGSTLGSMGGGAVCGSSCVAGTCVNCTPSKNLATQATATSSGGGNGSYGAIKMNDGLLQSSCVFHWISASSSPGGKWLQLSWPAPRAVGSVWFDTQPPGGACNMSNGRSLAGGTLQYWKGSTWTALGSVSGKSNDWTHTFSQVVTTKVRLYNAHTGSSGQGSNPIIYEWRVFCQ